MSGTAAVDSEYDFIVVGAGSAGAVVASRLSEGSATVLLLEAGPSDTSPWIHLPLGFSKTFRNPTVNWMYESDPEPHLGYRRLYWPKGKVLGGSSSINGLIWLRGLRSDYQNWEDMGNQGWSPSETWQVFNRIECVDPSPSKIPQPPVRLSLPLWRTELSEAFIAGAASMTGAVREDAFNSGEQLGGGYFLHSQYGGRRTSSATAYLRPRYSRPKLRVETGAFALSVQLEGHHARCVRYEKDGQVRIARARREIVLSGGAINTPQLLQLSGLGRPEDLERAGVRVHHALPGVGANFHDHFTTRLTFRTDSVRTTLNSVAGSWLGKARVGCEWLLKHSGPLTIGAGVAGAYGKVVDDVTEPDVQLILVPFKTDNLYKSLTPDAGFQVLVTASRPSSRGHVVIRTANPSQPPSMVANYLDTHSDRRTVTEGIRWAREVANTNELRPFIREEIGPSANARTSEELLQYAMQTGGSTQHQVGSCRMGSDELAVVDSRLRVHGVTGLRIADASVMPQVVSANTNAACFMIGERCAEFVKQEHADCFDRPLPVDDA